MTTHSGGGDGIHVDTHEKPSDAVLRSIAAKKGCDVLDLPPLHDSVDVEALNKLFDAPGVELLQFTYDGFEVDVEPGRIYLTEPQ